MDYERRSLIAPNHTCTHVLNHALLSHLGEGINQKGSLVDDEKLRFDFSFGKQVDPAALALVEKHVQDVVAADVVVSHQPRLRTMEGALVIKLRFRFGWSLEQRGFNTNWQKQLRAADDPFKEVSHHSTPLGTS